MRGAALALLLAAACHDGTAAPRALAAGTWAGAVATPYVRTHRLVLTQDRDSLYGEAEILPSSSRRYRARGTIVGDSVTLDLDPAEDPAERFAGRMRGDVLAGAVRFRIDPGNDPGTPLELRRQ